MNAITTFIAITEDEIISYFKDKNALSVNTAIVLNIDDLKKRLSTQELLDSNLLSYGFIKKTKNNKYYLDIKTVNKQTKDVIKIFLTIFIILLLSTIFTFLLYIFCW